MNKNKSGERGQLRFSTCKREDEKMKIGAKEELKEWWWW